MIDDIQYNSIILAQDWSYNPNADFLIMIIQACRNLPVKADKVAMLQKADKIAADLLQNDYNNDRSKSYYRFADTINVFVHSLT